MDDYEAMIADYALEEMLSDGYGNVYHSSGYVNENGEP